MSGAITAVAVVGAAYGAYSSHQQAKEQKKAAEKASQQAEVAGKKQESQAEQEMNKARSNAPDTSALLQQAAQAGGGSTMLTGAQGVDPNQLQISKNTLLGG